MNLWTAEQDKIILDNRGLMSHEQIAFRINREFGWTLTRSAISGRVDRLNLPTIRLPGRPKAPRINGETKVRKAAVKQFTSPPVPVEPLNILFGDLQPHHCREVVGQDSYESLSCGHQRIENSSYCRWHHAINHTVSAPRARPYFNRVAA